MPTYLLYPRRDRFAWVPVGQSADYTIPANARISLPPMGLAFAPVMVSQGVVSVAPISDTVNSTALSVVANPVVTPALFLKQPSAVTMTIASPCVITYTAHGFLTNQVVLFTTTGALPTGVTSGTWYYVINPTANTFQISTVASGAAVTTTGTQSGVHSLYYKV